MIALETIVFFFIYIKTCKSDKILEYYINIYVYCHVSVNLTLMHVLLKGLYE